MASDLPALEYVDDSGPGIARKKVRHGWAYFDPSGKRITDRDEIDRLNRIALPPAYIDAWFCPRACGHILATGIDAKVRKRVERDLASRKLTRERAIASVVRLLDLGAIRVGNESYARENRSFGATTLRMRHAKVTGGKLKLRFKAKSGVMREATISDRALARFVRKMQDLPGQHLFQYLDADGAAHPVGSSDVNAYLCETMGERFTAKNFRTWHASVLAFRLLADANGALTLKMLMAEVSEHLGVPKYPRRKALQLRKKIQPSTPRFLIAIA